ncbi:MAG: ornithine carbamoyltransferase [Candidatus Bathyarchaeota archaeon]|nr:MAG: ornithine carbamoyltransferase [Candidatus Bathyarchaeota archaeon]
MEHLINFKDWTPRDVESIIAKAIEIKRDPAKFRDSLLEKSLAMIFQKTSTRTRVSFEVAMTQLGGHAIYLDWLTTQFKLADIRDEIKYLSRNVDCIVARLKRNADLMKMSHASEVPVINGCDDKYHPCQVISDLMTIKEHKGQLQKLKIVYVGVHNNVCNSLIEVCTMTCMQITTVTPIIHEPAQDAELLEKAKETGLYNLTLDLKGAVKDADVVYTDSWVDMELFFDPKFKEEKDERIKLMMPYQINAELLKDSKALIMHDMPIHRDYEISGELIEAPLSIIYDQAENRLHSEKAILLKLLHRE